ncbi:MAG: hypothetical protein MUF66_04585 [Gammaproteobacteria bacterium]|jgi:hypothetical protein|nr:hypothetical protein [Gammaproteobacteria bacterium]
MAEIELAEVLLGLRKELQNAQAKGAKAKLKFRVDAIDVKIKVGVTKKGGGKGGIKFWVLDLGAEASAGIETVQTLRLKLTPLDDGGETLVSDRDTK